VLRSARFTLCLILGLGLLTWAASVVVHGTTRAWFEKDLRLRAQLAVHGARRGLVAGWGSTGGTELAALLSELARDERILAAAACSTEATVLASTEGFPTELSCASLAPRLRTDARAPAAGWAAWDGEAQLPGGDVHVSAIPVLDGSRALGYVVLVHDLSFVARREAGTRRFLAIAFGLLALSASAVTLIATRLSWRGWSEQLRSVLRGGSQRPEFRPILQDVRELVSRIAAEEGSDGEGGKWTAERLKHALSHHLQGEKVVIIANREPYVHEHAPDGSIRTMHPASGLVTALEPVMRACSGTWIAHGSGSADRETADRHGRMRVPPAEESYVLRRVWLSSDEEQGYYFGFANEGLWPLSHIAHTRPVFRAEDWEQYRAVNEKFADAVKEEVDVDDPIVLVQDYHFALAPQLIRQRLPRATVIMFWHIPWAHPQHFAICPWSKELLEGMLGSSILGFHTQSDCNHFVESVERLLEARTDREENAIVQNGRSTLVRAYPIALEWPPRGLEGVPTAADARAAVLRELGLRPDALLGIGVDRLDYTKGVEERLLAVERLLERRPELVGRLSFVQLAAPSRTRIDTYRALGERVQRLAVRINERFGHESYRPIVLSQEHHEPPAVMRFYRAADFCYVSSLHDGMNLVAKEFVAAREDERGVLILSRFTGAARELTEALIVNPYDLEQASSAMSAALDMSPEEQRDRMRAMRAFVAEFNVYRWAGRMLVDASRLRRRDRLTGRLRSHLALGSERVR